MKQLDKLVAQYSPTEDALFNVYLECLQGTQDKEYLRLHRDFVEENGWGYGERQFHYMWDSLVEAMPPAFTFLEIGVFQGQVLSLIQICAKAHQKQVEAYGITPLDPTGDHSGTHPNIDYKQRIAFIHEKFNVSGSKILHGVSFDPRVQESARKQSYDLMLIDGCHDYLVVLDDINVYTPMLKPGGYVVIDDAANHLPIPDGMIKHNWRGVPAVSDAVRDTLEKDPNFKDVLTVGHNRVFQKC